MVGHGLKDTCNCCFCCLYSRLRLAAVVSPLHVQDLVVEHWDNMPRYSEVGGHELVP